MSYWANKPISVQDCDTQQTLILQPHELLHNVNEEIKTSNVKLVYEVINLGEKDSLNLALSFINANYGNSNSQHTLHYNSNIVRYFAGDSHIALMFYPINKRVPVGFIIGSQKNVLVKRGCRNFQTLTSIEVNFLCLIDKLRNIHASSFMISTLAKECIERLGIYSAFYTVGNKIKAQHFCQKRYYHRPLNIHNMVNAELLSEKYLEKVLFATFSTLKDRVKVLHFNNESDSGLSGGLITEIHDKLQEYSMSHFDVFTLYSLSDVRKMFTTEDMHCFVLQVDGKTSDFVCMFTVDTVHTNGKKCRVGYMYTYFLENIMSKMEMIAKYCYDNDVFDMITVIDSFGLSESEYNTHKYLRGTGNLYYYTYNIPMYNIPAHHNGLVTI